MVDKKVDGAKQEELVRIHGQPTGPTGKTLAQLQAERLAETRFAEMMAAAGVPAQRMALEVLYMLPRQFVDAYAEVFTTAVAGKDDGGTGARGRAQTETAAVGKALGKTGAGGKAYKRHWIIADENALDIKERADKRLRALARDMRDELGGDEARSAGRRKCSTCKGMVSAGWRFCATCGHNLED